MAFNQLKAQRTLVNKSQVESSQVYLYMNFSKVLHHMSENKGEENATLRDQSGTHLR